MIHDHYVELQVESIINNVISLALLVKNAVIDCSTICFWNWCWVVAGVGL